MSGHLFFADHWYGFDDAIYAGVRLMGVVARMPGPLSSLRQGLPVLRSTPELRFNCDEARKFQVVAEVAARLKSGGATYTDIDGVRVQTEDGWWLLRASNTQAVLVARAESPTAEGLERLKAKVASQLTQSGLDSPDFSGADIGH
jgi:phosphomannomutase